MQVRAQFTFAIVVVDLAALQQQVTDAQVEDACPRCAELFL